MDLPRFGELLKILDDKTSGSENLLTELNSYILNCFFSSDEPGQFLAALKKLFPSFQIIQSYLDELMLISHDKIAVQKFLHRYNEKREKSIQKIIDAAINDLKKYDRILTISNSSTVTSILKKLRDINPNLSVYISESRPMYEGRITAENLLTHQVKTTIITEVMIPQYVKQSDAAIIGADKIFEDGSVTNKMGSQSIAIACKFYSKPFYVVARKMKQQCDSKSMADNHDTEEIWERKPEEIEIINSYFEIVSAELITKIFTD